MKRLLGLLLLGTPVIGQAVDLSTSINGHCSSSECQLSSDHLPTSVMLGDSDDDSVFNTEETSQSKRNMRPFKPTFFPGANLHELGHGYHSGTNGIPTTTPADILVKTVFLAHAGDSDNDAGDISGTQAPFAHTVTVIGQGNYSTTGSFSFITSKPSLSTLWPTGGYTPSNYSMPSMTNMTKTSSETATSTGKNEHPNVPHNHEKGPESCGPTMLAAFEAVLACIMTWALFVL